jgi:hypothetical protein
LYKEKFLWHARRLAFQAEGHGMYVSALGLAIHQWLNPPMKLELVGQNGLEFERLLAAARSLFYPGKTVSFAQSTDANAPAECRVCVGTQCYPPLQRGDDLARFRPQFGPAKVLVQSTVS